MDERLRGCRCLIYTLYTSIPSSKVGVSLMAKTTQTSVNYRECRLREPAIIGVVRASSFCSFQLYNPKL
jgi:hypothetical protein